MVEHCFRILDVKHEKMGEDSFHQKKADPGNKFIPLKPIHALLKENGVKDYDPRVIFQLLDFQYVMTKTLLNESLACASHRRAQLLSNEDVRLALEMIDEKRAYPNIASNKGVYHTVVPKLEPACLRMPRQAFVHDVALLDLVEEEEQQQNKDAMEVENGPGNIVTTEATGKYNIKRKHKMKINI